MRAPPATADELLTRYRQGERDFRGADFDTGPGLELRGARLDGVDLSGACVVADFRGASLRGARFAGANLKTCDFRDADLGGADFRGAALCATRFGGAELAGARFEGAFFHSHVLREGETPGWLVLRGRCGPDRGASSGARREAGRPDRRGERDPWSMAQLARVQPHGAFFRDGLPEQASPTKPRLRPYPSELGHALGPRRAFARPSPT